MSRTRIVGGKYTKISGGNHQMFASGSIVPSALETITEVGTEKGIVYGSPKTVPARQDIDIIKK